MDGPHDSTDSTASWQTEESVADKLFREAHLLSSGIVGGAIRELERDSTGTLVKAAVALGSGLALGAAACAASPWIAGGAAVCGMVATAAWGWSTFNTLDEHNRRRNAILANTVRAAWDYQDSGKQHKSETTLQEVLGRDALDIGLGFLSGIGAAEGAKYIPLALCKSMPEFGFPLFSQAAIARVFPRQLREFKILDGAESFAKFSETATPLAQLKVREILGYGNSGVPRLGKERQLLLAHNGAGKSITAETVSVADLLGCCQPQVLPPALRAKSVLQQAGRMWVDMDTTASTLSVMSESRYGDWLHNYVRPSRLFPLCSEKPFVSEEVVLGCGLAQSAKATLIAAARTIHEAEARFEEQTPTRRQVDALKNAYDVVVQRIGQLTAASEQNVWEREVVDLNRFKLSCFESMFKLYMERPSQFHNSSGHQRYEVSSNVTERFIARVFCDLLDKGRLKIELPKYMVIREDVAMQFKEALKQRLPELVTKEDFDAYIDPRNWMIIHEKGTAADHAKADILLCNKATGHYFAFDVTERTDISGAFQTNVALSGSKCYASTDRRPFIIASSDSNRPFWENLLAGKAERSQVQRVEQDMLRFLEQCILLRNPFHIMRHVLPYAEKGSKQAIEQLQDFQAAIGRTWPAWAGELSSSIRYLHNSQRRANTFGRSHLISYLPELEITDDFQYENRLSA